MASGCIRGQRADADKQLPSQPAWTRGEISQATLDSFNGGISENGSNEIAAARPIEFCRCLVIRFSGLVGYCIPHREHRILTEVR